jgi:hypothetical protein
MRTLSDNSIIERTFCSLLQVVYSLVWWRNWPRKPKVSMPKHLDQESIAPRPGGGAWSSERGAWSPHRNTETPFSPKHRNTGPPAAGPLRATKPCSARCLALPRAAAQPLTPVLRTPNGKTKKFRQECFFLFTRAGLIDVRHKPLIVALSSLEHIGPTESG